MTKKTITWEVEFDEAQTPFVERVILLMKDIPLDMLKSSRGKIEIDWADNNIIYKSSAYKNIT